MDEKTINYIETWIFRKEKELEDKKLSIIKLKGDYRTLLNKILERIKSSEKLDELLKLQEKAEEDFSKFCDTIHFQTYVNVVLKREKAEEEVQKKVDALKQILEDISSFKVEEIVTYIAKRKIKDIDIIQVIMLHYQIEEEKKEKKQLKDELSALKDVYSNFEKEKQKTL